MRGVHKIRFLSVGANDVQLGGVLSIVAAFVYIMTVIKEQRDDLQQ
jgi:hypothetical protein